MKRFHFPLSRVLDWRRTEVRLEEAKLERAHAEVRRLEAEQEQTRARQAEAEQALLATGSATGTELAAFSGFKKLIAAQRLQLERSAELARGRAAAQADALAHARQKVRLLEKVQERRHADWSAAMARELEAGAEEAYMAKIASFRREQEIGGR